MPFISPLSRSVEYANVHVEVDVLFVFSPRRSDDDDGDDEDDDDDDEDDDEEDDEDKGKEEDVTDGKKAETPPSIWVARPDTTPEKSDASAFS